MDKIIVPLSSKILEQFKFHYDGRYWVNPLVPFTLIKSKDEEGYDVISNVSQMPKKLISNCDTLKLLLALVNYHLNKNKDVITKDPNKIASLVEDYFQYGDPNIKLILDVKDKLIINPANEYTMTLMQGYQCKFKVTGTNQNNETLTEDVYVLPDCMSYRYARYITGFQSITSIEVEATTDNYEPFFGVGYFAHELDKTTEESIDKNSSKEEEKEN